VTSTTSGFYDKSEIAREALDPGSGKLYDVEFSAVYFLVPALLTSRYAHVQKSACRKVEAFFIGPRQADSWHPGKRQICQGLPLRPQTVGKPQLVRKTRFALAIDNKSA